MLYSERNISTHPVITNYLGELKNDYSFFHFFINYSL